MLLPARRQFVELYFMRSAIPRRSAGLESSIPVPKTQSAFPPRAQRNAFRRRDALPFGRLWWAERNQQCSRKSIYAVDDFANRLLYRPLQYALKTQARQMPD